MSEVLVIVLASVLGGVLGVCGFIIACCDISSKEVVTPKAFYEDGYNWFGSWTIFIIRTIIAIPFYIAGTIIVSVYKFIKWLVTVGR